MNKMQESQRIADGFVGESSKFLHLFNLQDDKVSPYPIKFTATNDETYLDEHQGEYLFFLMQTRPQAVAHFLATCCVALRTRALERLPRMHSLPF